MSSQISQIHMRKPLREPPSRRARAVRAAAGMLAIGTAAAWLLSSVRERPLAERTRARLSPRPVNEVTATPHAVPNASDIHVS